MASSAVSTLLVTATTEAGNPCGELKSTMPTKPKANQGAIRKYEHLHVEPLVVHRPRRLQRVHRAAVSFENDDRTVGRGDCGAGCRRQAKADRPAHDIQPVVQGCASGRCTEAAAGIRIWLWVSTRSFIDDQLPGVVARTDKARVVWIVAPCILHRLERVSHLELPISTGHNSCICF